MSRVRLTKGDAERMVRTSLSRPVLARICLVRYTSEQRAETNQKGENVQRGGILADKDAQAKAGLPDRGRRENFWACCLSSLWKSLSPLFQFLSLLSSPGHTRQHNEAWIHTTRTNLRDIDCLTRKRERDKLCSIIGKKREISSCLCDVNLSLSEPESVSFYLFLAVRHRHRLSHDFERRVSQHFNEQTVWDYLKHNKDLLSLSFLCLPESLKR